MVYILDQETKPTPEELLHYGVKGMKWGVRRSPQQLGKKKISYKEEVYNQSPGALKTKVITKTGETISVEKQKPSAMALAVGKLTGRKPPEYISSMVIRDSEGKKSGSFQIWKEDKNTVRGEWLEIKPSKQGQGYSRAAIEGLMISAKKDPNLTTIKMEVPRDAAAAQHIYKSLGFEPYKVLGDTPQFGVIDDWKLELDRR